MPKLVKPTSSAASKTKKPRVAANTAKTIKKIAKTIGARPVKPDRSTQKQVNVSRARKSSVEERIERKFALFNTRKHTQKSAADKEAGFSAADKKIVKTAADKKSKSKHKTAADKGPPQMPVPNLKKTKKMWRGRYGLTCPEYQCGQEVRDRYELGRHYYTFHSGALSAADKIKYAPKDCAKKRCSKCKRFYSLRRLDNHTCKPIGKNKK